MESCESCRLPTLVEGWNSPAEFRDLLAHFRSKRDRSALQEAGLPDGAEVDWVVQQSGHALFFEQKAIGRGDTSVHLKVGQHLLLPILANVGFAFVLLVEAAPGEIMRPDTRMWLAERTTLPEPRWGGVTVKLDGAFVPTSGAALVTGVHHWKRAAEACVCRQAELESRPQCFRPRVRSVAGQEWTEFDWRDAFSDPGPRAVLNLA